MKLWDYDPDTLLPNLPTMVTFPNLDQFYKDWCTDLRSKGVDIRLTTDVTAIVERSNRGVVLRTRPFNADLRERVGEHTGPATTIETFDEMVLAILADDAKRLLGKTASWREKFVLGGARFYDDITVTHSDINYFQKIYETQFNPDLAAQPKSRAQEDQISFAKNDTPGPSGELNGYRPMYFTHSYPEDPKKIEMSFDCTNYQHQFRMDQDGIKAPMPFDSHVFQSIFLDKTNQHLWTMDQIDESKIIEKKWWHQLGHRWQHYLRVVPGMMFINGRNHTWYAGSWTLVVSSPTLFFSILVSIFESIRADTFTEHARTRLRLRHRSRLPLGCRLRSFRRLRRGFLQEIPPHLARRTVQEEEKTGLISHAA